MKIFKVVISSIAVALLFLTLLAVNVLSAPGNKSNVLLLKAAEDYYLRIEKEKYELPLYLYHCHYDYQSDKTTLYRGSGENQYYIDSNEFDLSTISTGVCDGYIEQDSWYLYGDDALPTDFFLIMNQKIDSFLTSGLYLPSTISGIKEHLGDAFLGLPIPDQENGYEEFSFVTKYDNKEPVINGYTGTIISNVDSPITLDNIKTLLNAEDEVDGDLTDKIIIDEDNYSGKEKVLGEHSITFSVTDNSNNTATLTIVVAVVDVTSPIIEGPNKLTSNISSPLTMDEILEQISASDNYDGDLTDKIDIKSNTYESLDKTKLGNATIEFSVTDSSDNSTTHTLTITMADDIKPLISGDSNYVKNYDSELTLENILENVVANDNIDGDLKEDINIVNDDYSGNEGKIGTYSITLDVEDSSGNISNQFVIQIEIIDEIEPVFYVDKTVISTHTFQELSLDEIENYLRQTSKLKTDLSYEVEIIEDNYATNKNNPGLYNMKLRVKYEDNSTEEIELAVFVNDNKNDFSLPGNQTINLSLWDRILGFFNSVWVQICSFFTNTWKFFVGLFN